MGSEIYFVRHGESTANIARVISNRVTDHAPLTETGRQQAKELLGKLRTRGDIAIVYTSPLMRAKQAAEIIAAGLGAEMLIADALREPYCGVLEGRGDEEAWSHHARQEREWRRGNHDYAVPGGESFRDVERRFRPLMEELASRLEEKSRSTLVVSHGSILRNMLPRVLMNLDSDVARANPLGHCDLIVAAYQDGGLRCVEWCGLALENA
jgi:probable phosphoglycerate mutase